MYQYLNWRTNNDSKYLVGVNTKAKIPYGSTDSLCKMGNANAIVLPEPVLALPMQSLPGMIVSMQNLESVRNILAVQKCGYTSRLHNGRRLDGHAF